MGRFRDRGLNEHVFSGLAVARQIFEAWRRTTMLTSQAYTSPNALTRNEFAARSRADHN
jgi:hypothetical protein